MSIRKLLKAFKLTAYDEGRKGIPAPRAGETGFLHREIMVVLVTGTPVFTAKKSILCRYF